MQAVGQTRPGRLGDADRPQAMAAGGTAGGAGTDEPPAAFIDHTLQGAKVVAFTKVLCPSCRKAKEVSLPCWAAPFGRRSGLEGEGRAVTSGVRLT